MLKSLVFTFAIWLLILPLTSVSQTCSSNQPSSCINTSCSEELESTRNGIELIRRHNEILLQSANGKRTHLYSDKKKECGVAAAVLNDSHFYIQSCSETPFVADRNGIRLYKMPNFKYWDIVSNTSGTTFAVFERGRSFTHEFGQGTYDRLRLVVYKTESGEKLFEHKWSASSSEAPTSEQIGLSDDGSILYLCRGGETPVQFQVPGRKHP